MAAGCNEPAIFLFLDCYFFFYVTEILPLDYSPLYIYFAYNFGGFGASKIKR